MIFFLKLCLSLISLTCTRWRHHMFPKPVGPTRPICAREVPGGEDLRTWFSFPSLHFNPRSCFPHSVGHTLSLANRFSNCRIFLRGNTACDGAGVVLLHLKREAKAVSGLLALLRAPDWAPSSTTLATDAQRKFCLQRFFRFWNNLSSSSSPSSAGAAATIRSPIASIISKVVVAPESKPFFESLEMLPWGIADLLVFCQNFTSCTWNIKVSYLRVGSSDTSYWETLKKILEIYF